jgi:hypothetical protein
MHAISKAEQLELAWKSSTKTTCFADLAKRIERSHTRSYSQTSPRWTEYHFSDGSSIRSFGRGAHHRYEVYPTRRYRYA